MSYLDKFLQPEVIELSRRVRTQAGAEKFNTAIGTLIEADETVPGPQTIRANGVKPGQQIKTKDGYQTVGVTREDRIRKGAIHVYGTDGKLLLTIQSSAPVSIKVRIPEVKSDGEQAPAEEVALSKVTTEAGTKKYGVPKGSKVSSAKTPLKSANKAISKAVDNMVQHGRPTFTRKGWHDELSNHVKKAYPGVTMSLRKTPGGHVAVDAIKVDEKSRGKGYANKAMKDLVDVADHMGATLALSPADGKVSKWHESWGFEKHTDPNIRESHRRVPKVKKK